MKILVRATNWLGDAVLSLPAIRALRAANPQAEMVVLARPWVAALYEGEHSIDRVIPLTAASGARDWRAKWKLGAQLRKERFDLAVLLPNSFESAAIVWLSGARRRVGYARDGRALLLTDAIDVPRPGEIPPHERYYYPELLRRAGLIEQLPEIEEILFDGLAESRARGASLFAARGIGLPVIGINPGAAFGTAKRWLPERFAEAARQLAAAHSASIAVFGTEAERQLCGQVAAGAGGHNLAGATTLREFIDMTAACSFCLANDSGAMHVCAAAGVPSVTVFGPTDETRTGPVSARAHVLREPVDCAPCGFRECPIDHRCMTRVTTDRVVAAAEIKESQP
ncbi:MAG TPA: lipopolysaccharide heptosyltransferase II [Bryobacteraceae bacterium]|nr:lipopolysaccharide heptosyltransferase II [Bryobacteraceae bacterium]